MLLFLQPAQVIVSAAEFWSHCTEGFSVTIQMNIIIASFKIQVVKHIVNPYDPEL